MTGDMLSGLIRHALTVLGGVFITKGYLDATMLEALAGAVATIAGVGWSIFVKRAA